MVGPEFPRRWGGGGQVLRWECPFIIFGQFFPENCMELKRNGPRGGEQGLAFGTVNDSGVMFLSIKLINVGKINYTLNNLITYRLNHFFCLFTA